MVEILLRADEIGVVRAATIDDAWRYALDKTFDLYLLDAKVEDGHTLHLCRKLNKLSPETPILFYSGEAHKSEIQRCLAAGAVGYLVKPFFGNLAETVTNLIAKGPTRRHVDLAHTF